MAFTTNREEMRGFTKLEPDQWAKKREYRAAKSWDTLDKLATALNTSLDNGTSDNAEMEEQRKQVFGENKFASLPMKTYCEFVAESFEDPVLMILLGAVAIAFIVGMIEHPEEGWIEAVAILVAVIVVSQVTAMSDYNKQAQFADLYSAAESDQGCSVIRGGEELQLHKHDIVVGDLVVLRAGIKVPADGLLVPGSAAGNLACDEADLTGESLPQVKTLDGDDYFHADTNVKSGSAMIMVVAVGSDTITGQIKEDMLEKEDEETPLQKKLNTMVDLIGYVGVGAALLTLIALMIRQGIDAGTDGIGHKFLDSFIVAVTIVVVAVPEGLPLAVTIALAYSMGAMYHDHIFVKVLSACETMGGSTCICSDKTGTLTQNIMSVAGFWFGDVPLEGHEGASVTPECTDTVKTMLGEMIALNSEATITRIKKDAELRASDLEKGILDDETVQRTGSATDCALLELHERLMGSSCWAAERKEKHESVVNSWPFSSVTKKMGVAIKFNGGVRLYVKGAAEKVVAGCTNYMDSSGNNQSLQGASFSTPPQAWIEKMQTSGFRVIAMCYRDYSSEAELLAACGASAGQQLSAVELPAADLNLFGIAAIHDPLRPEVTDAVAGCKKAGVKVVMVTGDAKPTAMFIAKSCGIYHPPHGVYGDTGDDANSGIAIEAAVYRRLYDAAQLAQYGSRKMRALEMTETKDGEGNSKRQCKPSNSGGEGWRSELSGQNEDVLPGNRQAADEFSDWPEETIFSGGQLDTWACGVRNEYDDSGWDAADQASVAELASKAKALYLGCTEVQALWEFKRQDTWVKCDDWCSAELEALQGKETAKLVLPTAASGVTHDIRLSGADANVRRSESDSNTFLVPLDESGKIGLQEQVTQLSKTLTDRFASKMEQRVACEKLAAGIIPPLDRSDKAYMALNDKARSKQMKDGGPLAQQWWAKVDSILYGNPADVVGSEGLQVLARSLPDDKLKLVKRYMLKGEIVGVTGDGTNDAPALRHANVGLAMGSGTDVAKDAAEITITNDNFASIVQAIMWGRNIFDNIRKFLQFQLTVNVVALLLTFIMACVEDGKSKVKEAIPLNAVMLLWVNLIMDSMGALALATEKPSMQLLDRPPHGRERLLSVAMIRMVIGQSVFQLIVLLVLSTNNSVASYVCDCETDLGTISTRQKTAVFNAFVFCQFFNEINCRTIKELNFFAKFFDSPWFTIILIFTAALQTFMIEVGGDFVGTNGLSWRAWLVTIAIGAIALPVGFIVRLIPVEALEKKYGFMSDEEMEEEAEEEDEEEANVSIKQDNDAMQTAKVVPEEEVTSS